MMKTCFVLASGCVLAVNIGHADTLAETIGGISSANVLEVAPISASEEAQSPIVHKWLDVTGSPVVRFSSSSYEWTGSVPIQDSGIRVLSLTLNITTGIAALQGGPRPGDNCTVILTFPNGNSISLQNVNNGGTWATGSVHSVIVPIPSGGLRGGDIRSVQLRTGFVAGIGSPVWDVQRVELQATLR
jgi:hypothetical protein